jgi:hypothetical protein
MPHSKPCQRDLIGRSLRHDLVLIESLVGYSSETATSVVCPRNTTYFNRFRTAVMWTEGAEVSYQRILAAFQEEEGIPSTDPRESFRV